MHVTTPRQRRRSRPIRHESDLYLHFVTSRILQAMMWLHPLLMSGMRPPSRRGRRMFKRLERRADRRLRKLVEKRNRHRRPSQPEFDVKSVKRMLRGLVGAALARAQELTGVEIYAVVVMSNHLHLVVRTPNKNLSLFMRHVKAFITTKINTITGESGTKWQGRYNAQPVLTTAAACERIGYTIGNPVSANLVAHPEDWPGLNLAYGFADASLKCVEAGTDRDVLSFEYFSSEKWHEALSGEKVDITRFIYERKLELKKLPEFGHLDRAAYKRAVHAWVRQSVEKQEALEQIELPGPGGTGRGDVVEEMLKQTLKKRKKKKRTSRKPLGVEGVFNKAFTDRPECPKRSRRPAAYGDRESVRAYIEDKAELTQHYEWASERFRAGEQDVEFPPGTYPPMLPCTSKRLAAAA